MQEEHAGGGRTDSPDSALADAALLEHTLFEVKKVIVGQDRAIERLLVCLLARGHALLEGVPGLAKTLAAETIARTVSGTFARLQFTPDLLPADVMGTRIYRASTETFDVELGPVFANFVLADEINRAPAKVQSALLEVMAEHQVSIGGVTHPVPQPFLVLATQNPIESEGVYPLPEAQRDRFLMKIMLGYPTPSEEVEIVYRMGVNPPEAEEVLNLRQLLALQDAADAVYVDRAVVDYAVTLVLATRDPSKFGLADIEPFVSYGASPRASLGLIAAGRALALMRDRAYVLPQDVFDVAPDVIRHRLVLSYEALAQGTTTEDILARLLSTIPAPRIAPSQHHEQDASPWALAPTAPIWSLPAQPPGSAPAPWAPPPVPPTGAIPPASPLPPPSAVPPPSGWRDDRDQDPTDADRRPA
jgi:MoxR-like ATPase